MNTEFAKTPDGTKIIRIETASAGAPARSTAQWIAEQVEKGTPGNEIEEMCGATITGCWYTFKGKRARS